MLRPHKNPDSEARNVAASEGRTTFYGRPCADDPSHANIRYTVNGRCVACTKATAKPYQRKPVNAPTQLVPISRAEASAAGLSFFFTGKRCKHGHLSQRYVSTGSCVMCIKAAGQETASRFRKDAISRQRGHFSYPLHPDDVAAATAYCQGLDLARGRMPFMPPVQQPTLPVSPEQIAAMRARALGAAATPPPMPPERDLTR